MAKSRALKQNSGSLVKHNVNSRLYCAYMTFAELLREACDALSLSQPLTAVLIQRY